MSAAARISYRLSTGLSAVAGYGYQEGRYSFGLPADDRTRVRSIDAGIDYSRALSISRKTTLAFRTGTTAVEEINGAQRYQLVGDARLTREFGRTWRASGAYLRGVGFVEGFREPMFSDSFALRVEGNVGRRVLLALASGYSRSHLGAAQSSGLNESYNGTIETRISLNRLTAISAEYGLYDYRFDRNAQLPDGMPASLHRRGFRIGMDIWLPLIR
jgi:hypothetical protein